MKSELSLMCKTFSLRRECKRLYVECDAALDRLSFQHNGPKAKNRSPRFHVSLPKDLADALDSITDVINLRFIPNKF